MSAQDRVRSHERINGERRIENPVHDPYRERYRPEAPAYCPDCGVVYHGGRWEWKGRPRDAHEHVCPACHRIRDQQAAGHVTLQGRFYDTHADEIVALLHNEEARAKAEHPLERIMSIERTDHKTVIRTTDVHLARRLGDAIHHAYQGQLDIQYARDEYLVRVNWTR
jgi:NMD protein affecting ribosome stability and mRNA decay